MGVVLDIIFSNLIRASIILLVLIAMVNLNNSLFRQNERVVLNTTVASTVETIVNDVKLAGYGASTSKLFAKADSVEMSFYSDLGNDGSVKTVRYYLTGASGTHRILYRTLNAGTAFEIARDVVLFRLSYYSITGTSISGTNVSGVKSIKITLTIESGQKLVSKYSGVSDSLTYQSATWEGQIFPSGL